MNKPIKFTHHALESMKKRGTTEAEVIQAVNVDSWKPAKSDRFECVKDFTYNNHWNGKCYNTKQVMPIFKNEEDYIVIITVYVFYF
jgi:hypothetical protein